MRADQCPGTPTQDPLSALEWLRATHPMVDAVIDQIDGRRIRIGGRWLVDFASCNYLGLDLDREIASAVPAYLERWGTHPSWSRLLGSPVLYPEIEQELTELLGAEDTLLLPTITHIHHAVLPALAGSGTVYLDSRAHRTVYDGCRIAHAGGATLRRYRSGDLDQLESALRTNDPWPRLICMDGVNSMTANVPDLAAIAALADRYGAELYIDDAHGFGLLGERPDELAPWGRRGNGVVRHTGLAYDDLILVAGLSKAYSSLLAFVACPQAVKNHLKVAAAPYLYSGPSPVASLATALEGLRVNERRGDQIRGELHRKVQTVLATIRTLGVATPNRSGLPVIELPLASADDLDLVGRFLFERGIYVTLAAYPLVPRDEVGFRVQVTAANTDAEIAQLCEVLAALDAHGFLQEADD